MPQELFQVALCLSVTAAVNIALWLARTRK